MIKTRLLFSKFILISLFILSAPLQAAFSFASLYNSVIGKKATKVEVVAVKPKKITTGKVIAIVAGTYFAMLILSFGLAILDFQRQGQFQGPRPWQNAPGGEEPRPYMPRLNVPRGEEPRRAQVVNQRQLLNVDFMTDDVEIKCKLNAGLHEVGVDKKECPVCSEDRSPRDIHKMGCCGMEFCKECLLGDNGPINQAIKNKNINALQCMNTNCNMKNAEDGQNRTRILPSDLVALLGQDSPHLRAIDAIKDKKDFSLIKEENGYRECRSKDCRYYYLVPVDNNDKVLQGDVVCPGCHSRYCVDCQISHSANINCVEAKAEAERVKKLSKTDADRETDRWKAENTKPCPNCQNLTQKNGGCKHMTCDRYASGCGWEYCWDCMQGGMGRGGYPHRRYYECPKHPELKSNNN